MRNKKRSKTTFFLKFSYQLLKTSPWLRYLADESISLLKTEKRLSEEHMGQTLRFLGRWIDSVETQPCNEEEIVKRVISSFNCAKKKQNFVDAPYLPSGRWKGFFDDRLQHFYKIMSQKDYVAAANFFRNFFRNEAISGIWSGDINVFQTFCDLDDYSQRLRALTMIENFLVWKNALPNVDLKKLDAPRFGNPWGYRFDDYLLYEPVFIYNYHAHLFSQLLNGVKKPVVVEIGGGFGGLAHHLIQCCPNVKYIGYDLPENIAIQTYYLSCIFPNSRVFTYQEDTSQFSAEELREYDIILLPNFELKRADSQIADLVINVRGLGGMSLETIREYFSQIDRIGRLFFYHENLFKERKDGLYAIPSRVYPSLKNFVQLYENESRWPIYKSDSNYPCQEHLFIHRSLISDKLPPP